MQRNDVHKIHITALTTLNVFSSAKTVICEHFTTMVSNHEQHIAVKNYLKIPFLGKITLSYVK